MMREAPADQSLLAYRGGLPGALMPFLVFLAGVIALGLGGAPDERGFWPVLIAALGLQAFLARDRRAWSDAVLDGMSRRIVLLMVLAWLLAGVMASVLGASGLVEALAGTAHRLGIGGGVFAAVAFAIAAFVSTATGTSLGTILLVAPLLYPAGVGLGAAPGILAGAILGGATFGDNVSPVSDTTIASASTQEAPMGVVVRSRLRYALPAAAVAIVLAAMLGGTGATSGDSAAVLGAPRGLAMLGAPLIVIALLMRGGHLVPSLLAGGFGAAALSVVLGLIAPSELFGIDRDNFTATGLILDGLERGVGVSVFTLLLMGLTGGLERSGILDRATAFAESHHRNRAGAEAWMVGLVTVAVMLTTHAVVAILLAGPFARRAGERYELAPARRANLLDVTVSTWPFLLPWFIPTILMSAMTRGPGAAASVPSTVPPLGPWTVGLLNFHAWGLLLMLVLAVGFGYGRRGDR